MSYVNPSDVAGIRFVLSLVYICLSGIVLYWTQELSKQACACSKSWKRDFLTWGHAISIALRVAFLIFSEWEFDRMVMVGLSVFHVALMGIMLSYATDLERMKCECSEGWKRRVAFFWPVVYFSMIALAFLLAITIYLVANKAKS
jgi:hypothetical protein